MHIAAMCQYMKVKCRTSAMVVTTPLLGVRNNEQVRPSSPSMSSPITMHSIGTP